MIITIFLLLVVYQLKHFVADYPLQGTYMLGKFKEGWEFLGPLAAHCTVHAIMTFCIAFYFTPFAWAVGLAALDFVLHFIMDRLKAGPKYLGKYKALNKFEVEWYQRESISLRNQDWLKEIYKKELQERWPENKKFWWALGLDQMVHHLTHYLIIYIIVVGFLL